MRFVAKSRRQLESSNFEPHQNFALFRKISVIVLQELLYSKNVT
jgi:hypothetical protein